MKQCQFRQGITMTIMISLFSMTLNQIDCTEKKEVDLQNGSTSALNQESIQNGSTSAL